MNVYLLLKNSDFNLDDLTEEEIEPLNSDLSLDFIFKAMAKGDDVIYGAVRKVMFRYLTDSSEITYRQEILNDAFAKPKEFKKLYEIASEALDATKKQDYWLNSQILTTRFQSAVSVLEGFIPFLQELRKFADQNKNAFSSYGMNRLLSEIKEEIDDDFIRKAKDLVSELEFKDGMLLGLTFDNDASLAGYQLLRKTSEDNKIKWKMAPKVTLAVNDESGMEDISDRTNLALSQSVDTLTEAAGNVKDFLFRLQTEIGFYIGVLNLTDTLKEKNVSYCMPLISDSTMKKRHIAGLSEATVVLSGENAVHNDIDSEGKSLYIITGANQGGKSTFLRSIGQAQMMAQSGCIVMAQSFESHVVSGIFTHFSKLEDRTMKSGKLDEELLRMSGIADRIRSNALILFNESFQSTNEREGSEICREIVNALVEDGIEVFFVTHFFTFAENVLEHMKDESVFLKAERMSGGQRTFKIVPGLPEETAYGRDLYDSIF